MRTSYAKILIVAVIVGIALTGLLSFSGPRMRSVQYDKNLLTSSPSPRVIIRLNQHVQIPSPNQISISPLTTFRIVADGTDSISIDFLQPLAHNTDYMIRLEGIATKYGGRTAHFEIPIKTNPLRVAYLIRQPEGPDKIAVATIEGTAQPVINAQELFVSNDRIEEVVSARGRLVVNQSKSDSDVQYVTILDSNSGDVRELDNLMSTKISKIGIDASGTLIGFVGDNSELMFYDMESQLVFRVFLPGSDRPVKVSTSWSFSADGRFVGVINEKGNLVVISLLNQSESSVYGAYDEISGFMPSNDLKAVLQTRTGPKVLDLVTGEEVRVRTPPSELYSDENTEADPLYFGDGFLLRSTGYSYSTDSFGGRIVLDVTTREPRQVYAFDLLRESLLSSGVSFNNQYVFAETSEVQTAEYDNYPVVRRPYNVRTKIFDLNSVLDSQISDSSYVELAGSSVVEL